MRLRGIILILFPLAAVFLSAAIGRNVFFLMLVVCDFYFFVVWFTDTSNILSKLYDLT